MDLSHLTDEQLLIDTEIAVREERASTAKVLFHLCEVERRKAYPPKCSSLFDYVIKQFGFTGDEANRRISAVRIMMEVPEIKPEIASGKLGMTNVVSAREFFRAEEKVKSLTYESKLETLQSLVGKTTREVKRELIAKSSNPLALQPESVRPVSQDMNEIKTYIDDDTLELLSKIKGLLVYKHGHLSNSELLKIMAQMTFDQLDPGKEPIRKRKQKQTEKQSQMQEQLRKQTFKQQLPQVESRKKESWKKESWKKESRKKESRKKESRKKENRDQNSEAPATETNLPVAQQVEVRKSDAVSNRANELSKVTQAAGKISKANQATTITGKKPSRYVPAALRRKLYRESNGKCAQCGSHFGPQRDHKHSFALGGETSFENMQMLCFNCNQRKRILEFGYRGKEVRVQRMESTEMHIPELKELELLEFETV